MCEQAKDHSRLVIQRGRPLLGLFVDDQGQQAVHYFAGEAPEGVEESNAAIADALDLAGAWRDLDWQDALDTLDRIRHESRPTPPIKLWHSKEVEQSQEQ